ncbi:ficolin-1 [Elysia marginata]|uniref:Ficolin-1 n=1 Tax=Elysia marginata TaxID=1093978 RepID=A0AAV4H5Y9_9GAST|nr:ficolin-1 [Elysia marginata]
MHAPHQQSKSHCSYIIEAMHALTNKSHFELRVEVTVKGKDLFSRYSSFKIADESDGYRLELGSHSGTLLEKDSTYGLSANNGFQFSTKDRDNDQDSDISCADTRHGAWWYFRCTWVNLNGGWGEDWPTGLWWTDGFDHHFVDSTEMKIRQI